MARVVVLGAGIAGHTSAMYLRRLLGKEHEVLVVSPNSRYQWIPSNIWIGIGKMTREQTTFPLEPLYKKKGIEYRQARAVTFYPDENYVMVEYVAGEKKGQQEKVEYDYLINATGPKLNFEATEGLYPGRNRTYSVCSYTHAEEAWKALSELIEELKKGKEATIVIGMGHPKATCQGAAFEYILNVDHELRRRGVRDRVRLIWLSNEAELGDFGVDGMLMKVGRKEMHSSELVQLVFEERDIEWILGAGVYKVEDGKVHFETLDGQNHTIEFDFAMLIPAFSGHGFKAYDKDGGDITDKLFSPKSGFMIVDADYTPKPYEEWSVDDWPEKYQNPHYPNIFAPGIAFAPPHTISRPRKSASGREIFPAPPRTGMPSGIMGRLVAENVVRLINEGPDAHLHGVSMGRIGAACIASSGYGLKSGSAITITMFPIVPDYRRYPDTQGRDLNYTIGHWGLAGHWMKYLLHHMFLYKAKMKPFWWMIPE